MGGLLAGTTETPGEYFYHEGQRLKRYRGMGSIDAMNSKSGGVVGNVLDKGSVRKYASYLITGVQHSLQDIGCQSVAQFHEDVYAGKVRFEKRTAAAQMEGGVHGLHSFEKKLFTSS
ncbi:hypothetical protein G6F42_015723 [Rhizopus arrhizus]|nr:hypothetical protein G6F42_015723 [Rhizopus arrhizus]